MCFFHAKLLLTLPYEIFSDAAVELNEKLSHFLTRLEDIGVDGLPADLEIDLRQVMNLDSPSIPSRLIDLEGDDLDEDLLEPFGLSPEDCSQMAQFFQQDESRFFTMDEDFKSAMEPFTLLPDRLSLNLEGLDAEDEMSFEDNKEDMEAKYGVIQELFFYESNHCAMRLLTT